MKNLFLTMMTLTLLSTTVFAKSTTWICTNEFTGESAGKIEAASNPAAWKKNVNATVPMYYYSSIDSEMAWELSLDVDSQSINNASQMVQGGNPFQVGELVPSSKQIPGEVDVKLTIRGSKILCKQ